MNGLPRRRPVLSGALVCVRRRNIGPDRQIQPIGRPSRVVQVEGKGRRSSLPPPPTPPGASPCGSVQGRGGVEGRSCDRVALLMPTIAARTTITPTANMKTALPRPVGWMDPAGYSFSSVLTSWAPAKPFYVVKDYKTLRKDRVRRRNSLLPALILASNTPRSY